ncbi:hypothetical protein Y032_0332g2768 [Ancylostoma ceylanicum]|nr:hypothetical protein Y032_0332g2768 [Ancylostoma ceylanicum]
MPNINKGISMGLPWYKSSEVAVTKKIVMQVFLTQKDVCKLLLTNLCLQVVAEALTVSILISSMMNVIILGSPRTCTPNLRYTVCFTNLATWQPSKMRNQKKELSLELCTRGLHRMVQPIRDLETLWDWQHRKVDDVAARRLINFRDKLAEGQPEILICHDMKGGYLDEER